MPPKTSIFGTRIDNMTYDEIISEIDRYLQSQTFHQIATINAEILLLSEEYTPYRNILNSCDLNIADSVALNIVFWRNGEHLQTRLPGADIMLYVLDYARKHNLNVCCIVRRDGLSVAHNIRTALYDKYPDMQVSIISANHLGTLENLSDIEKETLTNSHIVLCNFGAPYQEVFLASLREHSKHIRLAIGVGGSFDYLTGKLSRAPLRMRTYGFEWLWRLIQQPSRIRRIWNAVIVFPIKVLIKS